VCAALSGHAETDAHYLTYIYHGQPIFVNCQQYIGYVISHSGGVRAS